MKSIKPLFMFTKRINFNASENPFLKIKNQYLIPFDWLNYLELGVFVFFGLLLSILGYLFDSTFYFFSLMMFIFSILYVSNRKMKLIKKNLTAEQNILLIQQLASKQQNVSQSLEVKGLFVFDYLMEQMTLGNTIYKNTYSESIIIYCETNRIWIGSLKSRIVIIPRMSNLNKWKKLIRFNIK